MKSKIIIVVFLATLATSSFQDDKKNENVIEFKDFVDEPIEYTDQSIGQKQRLIHKFLAGKPNNVIQSQLENFLLKAEDVGEKLVIRNRISLMQKEDFVLGNLFFKLYEKSREFNCSAEKIVKFVTKDEENEDYVQKLDHQLLETLKNFREVIINVH